MRRLGFGGKARNSVFEVVHRLPCTPTDGTGPCCQTAKSSLECRGKKPEERRSWLMRCRARPDLSRSTRKSASPNRVSKTDLKPPRIARGAVSVSAHARRHHACLVLFRPLGCAIATELGQSSGRIDHLTVWSLATWRMLAHREAGLGHGKSQDSETRIGWSGLQHG